MNPLLRLSKELMQLSVVLELPDFARYLGKLVSRIPHVIGSRSLAPVDASMGGAVRVALGGKTIIVPLDQMAVILEGYDPTPTFGGVREMYASNVYLRAFHANLRARTVVDLGSNRGLFLMLACAVLEAEKAVGVEPQPYYDGTFAVLARANGIASVRAVRVRRFVSSRESPETVTMRQIMCEHDLPHIDFVKCDVEGAEFDVFMNDNGFLADVGNIAMELHSAEGSVERLAAELRNFGFEVRVTDQFGHTVSPHDGVYLYAPRTGQLRGAP